MSIAHTTLRELVAALTRGQRAIDAGDLTAARLAVTDALDIDPENVQARDLLRQIDAADAAWIPERSRHQSGPRRRPSSTATAGVGPGVHGTVNAASWTAFEQRVRARRIARLLSEAGAAAHAGHVDVARRLLDELETLAPRDDRIEQLRTFVQSASAEEHRTTGPATSLEPLPRPVGTTSVTSPSEQLTADPVPDLFARPARVDAPETFTERRSRQGIPGAALAASLLIAAALGGWVGYTQIGVDDVADALPSSPAPDPLASEAAPERAHHDGVREIEETLATDDPIASGRAQVEPEGRAADDSAPLGNAPPFMSVAGRATMDGPRGELTTEPRSQRQPDSGRETSAPAQPASGDRAAASRAGPESGVVAARPGATAVPPSTPPRAVREVATPGFPADALPLPSVVQDDVADLARVSPSDATSVMARSLPPAAPLRVPAGANDSTPTSPAAPGSTEVGTGMVAAEAGGAAAGGAAVVERAARSAVDEYRRAFNALDAGAAERIWPTVDRRALDRAFRQLATQSITFEQCDVTTNGVSGNAVCSGRATWAPAVGDKNPRAEARTWRFTLAQRGPRWIITDAAVVRR